MNENQFLNDYERDILLDKVLECIDRRIQELISNKTEPHILNEMYKTKNALYHLRPVVKELPAPEKQPETPEIMEVYSRFGSEGRIWCLFNWMVANGIIFTNKSQSDLYLDSIVYINGDKYKIYVLKDPKKIKMFIGQLLKVLKTGGKKV